MIKYILLTTVIFLFFGCSGEKEFPVDKNGIKPDVFLKNTYALILEKKYDEAKNNYDEKYINSFSKKDGSTFKGSVREKVFGWDPSPSKLKVTRLGNVYNVKTGLWFLSIHSEEESGKRNRIGVACHVKLLNDEWKIVSWMDYR
ncbi:MAG: hypothetical protein COA79_01400 [Planctomycetota bacterium]|nr:MAG: hypothetical protein COA79_01400 [Planctomycetota bacterium]